ncbi:MAG: hypothetical protein ACRC41_15975 [Sarcina sp.]
MKDKDYLNVIEEIDENELPNVELNGEEKDVIKKDVFRVLKKLKERNIDFDVDIDEKEALEYIDNKNEDLKKAIYGVKNSKMMKLFIENRINEELKNENILKSIEYELPSIFYWGRSAIFNYAFITDEEFIWYGFDIDYKLVTKGREKLEKIRSAGKIRDSFETEGVEYCIRSKNSYFVLIIYSETKIKEMDEFIEFLNSRGVRLFNKARFAMFEKVFYGVLYTMTGLGLIYMLQKLFYSW